MPSPAEHIEAGVRHERSGALHEALDHYLAASASADDSALLAEAYRRQADVYRILCRWSEALDAAVQSAAVAEYAAMNDLLAEALNAQAMVYHSRGDFLAAVPLYQRMLLLTDSDRIRGHAHQNLASVAAARELYEEAEYHFRNSYRCFQRGAHLRGIAIALTNYGSVSLKRGNFELAEELCRRALESARGVEDLELSGLAMINYAEALSHRGDMGRAEELISAALGYFSMMENTWRRVECLRLLGHFRAAQGFSRTAAQCYSQALDLAQSIGALREAAELIEHLERVRPGD